MGKERADFIQLSSDLHTYVQWYACVLTDTLNNHKKKEKAKNEDVFCVSGGCLGGRSMNDTCFPAGPQGIALRGTATGAG